MHITRSVILKVTSVKSFSINRRFFEEFYKNEFYFLIQGIRFYLLKLWTRCSVLLIIYIP